MMKKHGKYFADWRDERGRRHRKAFPTAKRAHTYQHAQQLAASRKKAHRSEAAQRQSSRPTRKHSRRSTSPRASRANSRKS